jgi:5-methylcytosine-specific restriction endonuclease McrA
MADRTRPCVIAGCDELAGLPGSARGWCRMHYSRWQRSGDPLATRRKRNVCSIAGCDSFVLAHVWCIKHHTRWVRYGSPTHRLAGEVVNGCRICSKCGEDKPLSEWGSHCGTKTGLSAYCRLCYALMQKANRARPDWVRSPRDPEKEREAVRLWRVRNPDKVRSMTAAYRARKAAALVEEFSVEEIFQRDGWTCHICQEPIDQTAKFPDPRSASLDHVVPLSKGGKHSRDNCAAAHLFCNISKKDRIGVGRGATQCGSPPFG